MTILDSVTVAMLLSCDSFESFFGEVLQLDRESYVRSYRNDFSWYYASGLIDNGIRPIIYIPSNRYNGIYETTAGVSVRFLRCASWYRPIARLRRAMRATRWSLYAQERVNAAAFLKSLNESMAIDEVNLLYLQEYWGGRYDHLAHRTFVPISAADHGGVANGVVKWFKRRSFAQAEVLYCQSQDECSQVERFGGRTILQPNGVDTSFFVPPPSGTERAKTILTVARLTDKQKRTSDLIRAMRHLSVEWRLDIIGTGPDRQMLQSLAKRLGVESRVSFLGFKTRSEVRSSMQSCGVYAMPSANEAMCLAVLEAMCCGAAVVASRIRTFESLITEDVTGKLFPVGNVPLLGDAIEDAWDARSRLGAAASADVVERFNSKVLYHQLADSMRSIVRSEIGKPNGEPHTRVGI